MGTWPKLATPVDGGAGEATPCWTRAWAGGIVNPERPPSLELFSSPHPKPALWQNPEPEPALTLTLAMGQIPWGLQQEGKLGIT